MLAPRWRKVLKDLWGNKTRTILVILTIGIGVFAVAYVAISFDIILKDMDADFQASNPRSALIYTDYFDEDFLPSLAEVEGVGQVEGRGSTSGRLEFPGKDKQAISFTSIPPAEQVKIDMLEPQDPPTFPPLEEGEMYIERSALTALPFKIGEVYRVELGENFYRHLRLVAIVHCVNSFPFNFGSGITAYVSPETMEWLGGPPMYNQVILTVAENKKDEQHVNEVAKRVSDKIERSGKTSYFTLVMTPGRHFATDITSALGAMMGVLGGMSVLLSIFLVFNTINALLGSHVRQIGVMKAIGARPSQVAVMYLVLVSLMGVLAFALAVPLAINLATGTLAGISEYLNFDARPPSLPTSALVLSIVVALIVPLTAAFFPVMNGARMTVSAAISTYGLGKGHFGASWFDRLLEEVRGLPRPLLISLRNTFRRKTRLFLTLSTLVLAGGIFIGVFSLRAAMDTAIKQTLGYILSDVNLSFSQPYRLQKVVPIALSIPGVVSAEAWGAANAQVLIPGSENSTQVTVLAPPANSTLIKPTLTSGRWLRPEDENAIVIGNHMTAVRPELGVGDQITMTIDGKNTSWIIVGTYRMAGNVIPPLLYTNYEGLSKAMGQVAQATDLRIVTIQHDLESQRQIGQALEKLYAAHGVKVGGVQTGAEIIAANNASTDILVYFLLAMASLIAVVGGLGLTSTMSLNVMERTREIGVMRAVGASDGAIRQIVLAEGMLIGAISWILGAILAIPIGVALAAIVGKAFLQSPLDFVFSVDGFILWLVIVVVLSAFACLMPAFNASRMTVRETLAYE